MGRTLYFPSFGGERRKVRRKLDHFQIFLNGRAFFILKVTSKNVIPAKAGIQNFMKSLDSCFRRSDEFGIIRGSLKG